MINGINLYRSSLRYFLYIYAPNPNENYKCLYDLTIYHSSCCL